MGFGTVRKKVRTLIWASHRPLHGMANVKSLVVSDETDLKFYLQMNY